VTAIHSTADVVFAFNHSTCYGVSLTDYEMVISL